MNRKDDHISLVLKGLGSSPSSNGFEKICLDHNPFTEINFNQINLSTQFLARQFSLPLMISSMTGGGADRTLDVNYRLAKLANDFNIPMGLGSMRSILEGNSKTLDSFKVARNDFPNLFLCANLGAQQLVGRKLSEIEKVLDSVLANALIIHLNPLQEMIQPEGDRSFEGILDAIKNLEKLNVPIIIKETGCGFGQRALMMMKEIFPKFILDIGGFGGTHFGKIESLRNSESSCGFRVGERFNNWGISTLDSLVMAKKILSNQKIICSGGIKTGQDVVKALCLGADFTAMAAPFLNAVEYKIENQMLEDLVFEMKTCLVLLGIKQVSELNSKFIFSQQQL